jgi:alpha(1,3/1,4) fucosyltransferase
MNQFQNGTIGMSSNKKNLSLGFVDTFDGCADFFTDWLSMEYNVIRNDTNPDYLIFGDENFGTKNLQYEDCVKIFYTGENRRFWNYKCHHALTFDHFDDDRHYRLPLYVLNIHYLQRRLGFEHPNLTRPAQRYHERTRFCGFVNSNPLCETRNNFFHELSKYKQVDSAGPLYNNIGRVLPRGEDGIIHKINFLKECKFTICYENGSHPGYVTEKALEAWYAGSVPLYWGSPTVALDFNPNAMLSWHDVLNQDVFIRQIEAYDKDDALYNRVMEEPLFANKVEPPCMSPGRFVGWFRDHVYKGSRV